MSDLAVSADEEFAAVLDDLAAEALRDGDLPAAEYLWDASDWHWPPTEAVTTGRLMLLSAAMDRLPSEAGERRDESARAFDHPQPEDSETAPRENR